MALAVVVASATACSGRAPSAAARSDSSSSTTPATSGPPQPTVPTTTAPCIDLRRWTSGELAHQVVAIPSLDFNLPQLDDVVTAGVGGVLFLGSAPAPSDLGAVVARANARSPAGAPLLVMADEEGGGIQRLRPAVENVPWPRDMAASMTPQQVSSLAARAGSEMRAAGVNVDLAPVLDVDGGPGPSAIDPDGRRSFSAAAATASTYGLAFAGGLRRAGVVPVVKHFPGLGGASGNTDTGPAATRPIAELRASGLQPFRAAVAAGVPAVMVANASVPGLTTAPASLSGAVIQGLLRSELGFRGLVMTDSVSAGAIRAAGFDVARAAVAAVAAGADLVLFGSTLTAADVAQLKPTAVATSVESITAAMVDAVNSGQLPLSRLVDAAGHVLTLRGAVVCGR